MEVLPAPVTDSEKILAVLGYVFGIVAVVAIFIDPYKENPFVRLHAVQAIVLWVVGISLGWIPGIGWLVGLVIFVVGIIAAIKAFQGEYYKIPVVYDVGKGFIDK